MKLSAICILLFIAAATPVKGETGPSFRIQPFIGYIYYDPELGYANSISFGINAFTTILAKLDAGVSYETSTTDQTLETPGNSMVTNTRWHLLGFQLSYNIPVLGSFLQISPTAGAGFIHFSTPAITISLGALGSKQLPARSSNHLQYRLSVCLNLQFHGYFSFVCEPGIFAFSNSSTHYTSYFLKGGISIAIR